jgi:hypothetical protein
MPDGTDCVLCRNLDPAERQKMRASLKLWDLIDKITLGEPLCEQCFGAWADTLGHPSEFEVQKFRKRIQTAKKWTQKRETAEKQKRSQAASDVRPDRTSILRRMTELRRVKDSRLQSAQGSDQLIESVLWQPPKAEATILDTVENFRWLKDAGLSDQSALQHLEALASRDTSYSLKSDVTLRGYVARRLKMVDPLYLTLGDEILVQQLGIADKWVQDDIQWTKSEPAFPPFEWLTERISVDSIGSATGRNHAGLDRILARLTEHDELWQFSSPSDHWKNLAGRAGVALIRNGRSIAHVITIMN